MPSPTSSKNVSHHSTPDAETPVPCRKDSLGEALRSDPIKVLAVPAFTDNYFWLICNGERALVVDPGAAEPVLAALEANGLRLTDILLTHHHSDHIGGVACLVELTGAKTYGPIDPRIDGLDRCLSTGDTLSFWPDHEGNPSLCLHVLGLPGHTSSHIGFLRHDPGLTPWLFCGDTLFGGGCGRIFDGTATQLAASLHTIRRLPASTQVFCAHEYTAANLRFGRAVEPGNIALQARQREVAELRARGLASVPFPLAGELETNPFLRLHEPAVIAAAQAARAAMQPEKPGAVGAHCASSPDDPVTILAALRAWKNEFS